MELEIKTDSSNQKYIEVETEKDQESLRITYVIDGFTGNPCLRFNIRPHGKSPRPGPEFEVGYTPEILAAISKLLIESN